MTETNSTSEIATKVNDFLVAANFHKIPIEKRSYIKIIKVYPGKHGIDAVYFNTKTMVPGPVELKPLNMAFNDLTESKLEDFKKQSDLMLIANSPLSSHPETVYWGMIKDVLHILNEKPNNKLKENIQRLSRGEAPSRSTISLSKFDVLDSGFQRWE